MTAYPVARYERFLRIAGYSNICKDFVPRDSLSLIAGYIFNELFL